ncbi:transposase [Streptomyces amakusaensis]|uniref:Transposase n=1 Tax=Streptomyces amakusaensis TaxID=67271 RepID=A0ABW0ADI6_9ACTN
MELGAGGEVFGDGGVGEGAGLGLGGGGGGHEGEVGGCHGGQGRGRWDVYRKWILSGRRSRFVARGDLADAQWALLGTLLPKGEKSGLPPMRARRQLIDGMRFRVRTGVPWRDLPVEYGAWGRAGDLFRRWWRQGHTDVSRPLRMAFSAR